MKNISRLMLLTVALFAAVSLTGQTIQIVSLPHMFNASQKTGYIDMNNDNIPDFLVNFRPQDPSNSQMAYIIGTFMFPSGESTVASSDNRIVVEVIGTPTSPQQALQIHAITGIYSSYYEKGELIGPTINPDQAWYPIAMFFGIIEPVGSPSLTGTWATGQTKGYVAVQFYVGTQLYYGWLNFEVDPNTMWVKIHSSGYASAPSTPVPAGLNDPYSVPVPIIASLIGLGLIGGGIVVRRRRKK